MDNKIMNGMWQGPALSNMEKLSIRSFQDYGHEFHLWLSEPTSGIPSGVVCHSTDEIVTHESAQMFTAPNHFSDYFRAHMINKIGGWYVDLDTICLKPFDFPEPYAFVSEDLFDSISDSKEFTRASEKIGLYLSGCVFKAPAHAPFLEYIIEAIKGFDTIKDLPRIMKDINDGIGPGLFRKAIPKFGLEQYVKAPYVFDAVQHNEYHKFLGSGYTWNLSEGSYAIHLRRSIWNASGGIMQPDGQYPSDSMFEVLKKKHGVGQ